MTLPQQAQLACGVDEAFGRCCLRGRCLSDSLLYPCGTPCSRLIGIIAACKTLMRVLYILLAVSVLRPLENESYGHMYK